MKFTTEGIALAGRDLVPPFTINLRPDPGDDIFDQGLVELEFSSVERILPGKRLSGLARIVSAPSTTLSANAGPGGDPSRDPALVFAKIFYGKEARRYWQRELTGAARLADAGVPSPRLQGRGALADGEGLFILFEGLDGARPLDEHSEEDMIAAVDLCAAMHTAGLLQSDIHLENFVFSRGEYYVIDADGVKPARILRQHFANLAMLLAQRSPLYDVTAKQRWAQYAAARGEYVTKMGSADAMDKLLARQRRVRVRRYLKKTQRDCTEFKQIKNFKTNWLCDRALWSVLQRFLVFPEQVFNDGTPLKLGNSATVVRVELDGRKFVAKRYNVKSFTHRVRRWFKRRPMQAWCNGHHLHFLRIPTARPVALLEHKFGWFRSTCYLLMEDCGDQHLAQVLTNHPEKFEALAPPAIGILKTLNASGLQHGDLKATNLVLNSKTQKTDESSLRLIDYDSLCYGDSKVDQIRFMKNWGDAKIAHAWQKLMSDAGLHARMYAGSVSKKVAKAND